MHATQAMHRLQRTQAMVATHARIPRPRIVSALHLTPTLPAVATLPATATLPAVAALPATATLPAVAALPATATLPAVAVLATVQRLRLCTADPYRVPSHQTHRVQEGVNQLSPSRMRSA